MKMLPDLLAVFKKTIERWAKETGFIKRKRTLKAYDFLILMTIGQLGMKHPSLAGMIAAIEARISRIALHKRFTQAASDFLERCFRFILKQKIEQAHPIDTRLLRRFNRVLILDSSSWDVNEKLRKVLPGSGGDASKANCKLQAAYEYKSSQLDFLEITPGILPDNRYTDNLPDLMGKKDLALIDQGYFKIKTFQEIDNKKAFFLTRFFVGTTLANSETREPVVLEKVLTKVKTNACQLDVIMGSEETGKVPCRLICLRVSKQIANERRRRLKKGARKKGRVVSKRHLILCDWTLLVTNVSEAWLPAEMARALYTLRWQIELLFKQLKTILLIHKSDTSNEHRLRCELYGKLIVAILIHRIHAAINIPLWNNKRREVSMDKLYKRIQERAFILLRLLLHFFKEAVSYLSREINELIKYCMKGRQPSRHTTLEMLDVGYDQRLEIREVPFLS